MRRSALALFFAAALALPAHAEGPRTQSSVALIAPTPATLDNGDRIATTAWVNNFVNAGLPLASGKIWIGSGGNIATAVTPSGDCTISIPGVITCTQSAGNFNVIGNLTVGGSIIDGNGILFTNIAAPATPAAGTTRGYVDSTNKVLTAKNDAGTVSNTVVPSVAVANQFMTGIGAAGVITRAQPAFSDLSGQGTCAQEPALTGDVTTPAGSCATTLATVNANIGAFGSATQCVTVTNNAKGLTTAISAATCTPAIGSITGLGTGVATALGVNVGTAGSPLVNGGVLGTPSSGTGTNLTGIPTTGLTGTLQAAQEPVHTGDCTNTAGSLALTCLKTNGVSFTPAATAAAGQLPGTATNDSASAGNVGEFVTASVLSGSAVSLTSSTTANITSISLTAGDWTVWGVCQFGGGATTTVTYWACDDTLTSATLATPYVTFPGNGATSYASVNPVGILPVQKRFILVSTTTIYLVANSQFGASTSNAYGAIYARRAR